MILLKTRTSMLLIHLPEVNDDPVEDQDLHVPLHLPEVGDDPVEDQDLHVHLHLPEVNNDPVEDQDLHVPLHQPQVGDDPVEDQDLHVPLLAADGDGQVQLLSGPFTLYPDLLPSQPSRLLWSPYL